MYEINCFDLRGNSIDKFFQWDCDQKIAIYLNGWKEEYFTVNPEVHFTNSKRSEAFVTRNTSTSDSNSVIIVSEVPNILLQEPYPLLIYVYLTDATDVSSQRTVLSTEIPVRKRNKPSDYEYVENIQRVTAEDIKNEIAASTEDTRQKAIDDINQMVEDSAAILNDSQAIRDAAEEASYQSTIENNLIDLINTNGIELRFTNTDGDVTMAIAVLEEGAV